MMPFNAVASITTVMFETYEKYPENIPNESLSINLFSFQLLISSNVSQPSSYFNRTSKTLKAHFEWCAPDVPYTGINSKRNYGTFCCCNTDFCNKDEPDEPEQPFHKVQQLISGTKADYIELLKVASGLGIIETPDTNSLH
uniref:Uncharacterized protein n=1 Tax=Parascaris univalens TaxID=6257 RepID=A0A915BNN4_PARUN